MPRPKGTFKQPAYRLHRASGQAIVTINGKDIYLGEFGSADSKRKYARAMLEWAAVGRPIQPSAAPTLTITELIAMFYTSLMRENPRAEHHYKYAMRLLKQYYGDTLAIEFGPLKLKALRHSLLGLRRNWKNREKQPTLSRKYINHIAQHVKGIFKWAVENEVLPERCYHGLRAVSGLRRGRTEARESVEVMPVPEEDLEATRALVPQIIRDMIDIQLLTAMRPGELCMMRACDLDMSGDVWLYRPSSHKTEYLNHSRLIQIGPKAQQIIRPYLTRSISAFLFSPRESQKQLQERRAALMPEGRKKINELSKLRRRRRSFGAGFATRYSVASYQMSIYRACRDADKKAHELNPKIPPTEVIVVPWHVHQLRHNAATRIASEFGIEVARVVCGHRTVRTTERYAHPDDKSASAAIARVG